MKNKNKNAKEDSDIGRKQDTDRSERADEKATVNIFKDLLGTVSCETPEKPEK